MDRSTYSESYRSAVPFGADTRKRGVLAATLSAGVTLCLCIAPLSAQNTGASDKEKAPPKLSEIKPVEAEPNGSKIVAPDTAPATTAQKKPASDPAAPEASLPTPSTPGHAFDHAAGKVTGIALVSDTTPVASLLLEQLQNGQMSAAAAWESGQLNGKLALELLAHQELFRVKWRAIVNELAALVATNEPELIADVEKVHPQAKAHLAAYFGSVGDSRAVPFYESILAAIKDPPLAVPVMPVFKLSDYYAKIGDFRKAAETRLRMKDYTTSAASLGNSEVEAARFYRQIGEEEKAKRLYEGASRHGYGWATGLALYDQASVHIEQSRHEEARKLLSSPINGQYVEHIKIALWSLLARSYFETGNWTEAEHYAKQTIELSQSMELLKREGLEAQVESARMLLRWIEEGRNQGIIVMPNRVQWIVRPNERPVRQWLTLLSTSAAPLQITTTDEQFEIEVMPQAHRNGELFEHEFALRLKNVPQSFETGLNLQRTQQENALFQVTVSVKFIS